MAPDTDPPSASSRQAAPVPHGHGDDPLHNEDVAHEHSDINIRAIVVFLVGLTLVGVLSAAAMWVVFIVLDRQAAKNDPTLSPLARPAGEMPKTTQSPYFSNVPQGPRLMTNEPAALEEIRAREQKVLETGDWVDKTGGIGRIPIADAKKALLQKGIPTRAGEPMDPRVGTREGAMTDAASGRLPTMKPAPAAGAAPQPPAQQPAAPPKVERKPGGGQ